MRIPDGRGDGLVDAACTISANGRGEDGLVIAGRGEDGLVIAGSTCMISAIPEGRGEDGLVIMAASLVCCFGASLSSIGPPLSHLIDPTLYLLALVPPVCRL
jgi:hypothetical protein